MNANKTFDLPELTDTQRKALMAAKTCTASTEKLRNTRKLPVGPASAALAKLGLAVKWFAYGDKRHSGYVLTDEGMLVFETYIAHENRKRANIVRYLRRLADRLSDATTPWGMGHDDAFGVVSHLGDIEDKADALFETLDQFETRAHRLMGKNAPAVEPPSVG